MCRFCVGNLFTNKSLFSGWSDPDAGSYFREGPSRRTFMALAGAAAGATGLGLHAGRAFAQTDAAADLIFEGGTIIPLASAGSERRGGAGGPGRPDRRRRLASPISTA